jgi:hypothetical protein
MYRNPLRPSMRPPAGYPPPPYPVGAVPTTVAPVRRVVHPTVVNQRRVATRYPVENVYPSHTVNIHDHICEYSCSYPHSESHKDCYYKVVVPTPPRRY